MKALLIIVMAVLYSCASTSAEWSEWKEVGVAQADQDCDWCTARRDGPEYHRKGVCWQSKECRTRNPWYSGEKTECRRKPLFCAHGDLDCMDRYGILNKVIVDKERLK